jgi:hypothetical protein
MFQLPVIIVKIKKPIVQKGTKGKLPWYHPHSATSAALYCRITDGAAGDWPELPGELSRFAIAGSQPVTHILLNGKFGAIFPFIAHNHYNTKYLYHKISAFATTN